MHFTNVEEDFKFNTSGEIIKISGMEAREKDSIQLCKKDMIEVAKSGK